MRLYARIGQSFPRNVRVWTKRKVDYSSIKVDSDRVIGFAVLFGGGVSVLGGLVIEQLTDMHALAGILAFMTGFWFLIYLWLDFSARAKTKFVEDVLPDALQIMSSNIRAGLTIDKALLMAARDELGPLGEEIRRIGKETMAGENITSSLLKTKRNVDSKHTTMAINLIVQSLESGGELADILDETANDIRDQQIIQKEVQASVLMYVFFIFIAVGFGAPLLFAISSMLVGVLSTNMELIMNEMPSDFQAMGGMPISVTGVSISPEFIGKYVNVALFVTSFFGALAIGLIMNGEEKTGLKFLPILLILSLGLYHLVSWIIGHFIGGLMNIGA